MIETHEQAIADILAAGGVKPDQYDRDYFAPWQVALRRAPGASVCVDPNCDLSGGAAHVGDCEPCGCGKQHAMAECPERCLPLSARDLVHAALADAYRARGRLPRPVVDDGDLLPSLDAVRIEIVRRIEVLRDGRETTRLFDAWRCRTVGELIQAVERAFTPGACGLCREPLVDGACIYCGTRRAA